MQQNKAGVLYVVATPVGNLGDITARALSVLSSVDVVAAEDTRHTRKLLSHHGIDTKLVALHEHNEAQKSLSLLQQCLDGKHIALVSDAGTPLISDPGQGLIQKAYELGVQLVPIPGPCAAIAALSVSGLSAERFVFEGFLPARPAPLLKDDNNTYQQNSQRIWDYLENLNHAQLQDLDLQTEDPKIQSWAELALLFNQTDSAPGQLSDALNQWRSKFPNQLANSLLPTSFNTNSINNQKIALLVPLDGTYGASGTAVRNGFFAAYYYWKNQLNRAPDITVINTANTDINTAYQQALQQGATIVVGPLTKPNINNLISHTTLTVPTLALNNLPNNSDTPNLYQFGLSPINEAQQTALKALQNQHSNALIITSNTEWGKNIANSFSQTWQQHGGRIVDELNYNQASSLSAQLRSLLNIDQTRKRAQQLRWLLGEKFRYVPRRRKDFDSIFFVGTDKIGKQVRPLLKYYYAGNVPIYSISPVYAGNANVLRDRDLNGILFCDIPWVLEQQKLKPSYLRVIKHSIQTQWPRSYRQQPKLYAFGVDAFDITLKLNKMMMLPLLGTHAATGTLYLQANRQIYRQLPFAQFVKGRAELVR